MAERYQVSPPVFQFANDIVFSSYEGGGEMMFTSCKNNHRVA